MSVVSVANVSARHGVGSVKPKGSRSEVTVRFDDSVKDCPSVSAAATPDGRNTGWSLVGLDASSLLEMRDALLHHLQGLSLADAADPAAVDAHIQRVRRVNVILQAVAAASSAASPDERAGQLGRGLGTLVGVASEKPVHPAAKARRPRTSVGGRRAVSQATVRSVS